MNAVSEEHAEHRVVISNKNDPIFEKGSLPNNSATKQLHFVQPLNHGRGRIRNDMTIFIDRIPIPSPSVRSIRPMTDNIAAKLQQRGLGRTASLLRDSASTPTRIEMLPCLRITTIMQSAGFDNSSTCNSYMLGAVLQQARTVAACGARGVGITASRAAPTTSNEYRY